MLFVSVGPRQLVILVLGVVVIGLGIVILSEGVTGSEPLSLSYAQPATVTPAPVAVIDPSLPGGASAQSALVLIQGLVERRLVFWPLAGDSPVLEVDRYVHLWPLLPNPAGSRLLYSTDGALMILDIAARRAQVVGELPEGGTVKTAQWSPDGSGIVYVVETKDERFACYTAADGVSLPQEMIRVPGGLPLDVGWLADSQPVAILMGVGPTGGLEARYRLYDPATGGERLLPSDIDVIQPWSPWLSPDGTRQVYPASEKTISDGVCETGPMEVAGAEWMQVILTTVEQGKQTPAFQIDRVYLDRAYWLDDGRIVMRGVANEICAPKASGLYVGQLGDQPVQIVEAESASWIDDQERIVWSVPYAVSPDESLVAWVKNDVEARQSEVYLTPVDGGEAQLLLEAPPTDDSRPFAFQDTQMILQFAWLP